MKHLPNSQEVIGQLRIAFTKRVEKNPSYSLRAFARDLDISHSHLSRIFSQKRTLSVRRAVRVAMLLHLDPVETQHFLNAVFKQYEPKGLELQAQGWDQNSPKNS